MAFDDKSRIKINLQVLMATMNRRSLFDIDWDAKNIGENEVLVINQTDFDSIEKVGTKKMISNRDRGSSKSRNLAIKEATEDICILADDDIIYVPGFEKKIIQAFEKNKDADIITFQIITPEGKLFNRGYPKRPQKHNKRSILRCASIEIAFKRSSIIDNELVLDELFGLGSPLKIHDEVIFLNDALSKGLKLYYEPIPIVIHPEVSSGTSYCDHLLYSKGAAFRRLFGIFSYGFIVLFAVKKHSEYKERFTLFQCLKLMIKGSNEYLDMEN